MYYLLPRQPKNGPRTAQDRFKTAQEATNTAERAPGDPSNRAQRSPLCVWHQCFMDLRTVAFRTPASSQRPKMHPSWPQYCPRWPQEGPKTAQGGSKRAQERSNRTPNKPNGALRWLSNSPPQNGPESPPRRPPKAPKLSKCTLRRPRGTSRDSEASPRRSSEAPRGPDWLPRCPCNPHKVRNVTRDGLACPIEKSPPKLLRWRAGGTCRRQLDTRPKHL